MFTIGQAVSSSEKENDQVKPAGKDYIYIYVSAVAVLKGCVEFVIYKCWRIFDVILRLASVILGHMQKRKIMEVNGKSAWNGFNLGLGSNQVVLKCQVSLSRSFFGVLVFHLMSQLILHECFLVTLWYWFFHDC